MQYCSRPHFQQIRQRYCILLEFEITAIKHIDPKIKKKKKKKKKICRCNEVLRRLFRVTAALKINGSDKGDPLEAMKSGLKNTRVSTNMLKNSRIGRSEILVFLFVFFFCQLFIR